MSVLEIVEMLNKHGPIIIFIVLYLEGLNLTGIPSNILMPAIGVYMRQSPDPLWLILGIGVVASVMGNVTFYWLALKLGDKLYHFLYKKIPITRKSLDKTKVILQKHGNKACLIGRLIPGIRTFISLVSGIFKVKFKVFLFYSVIGIVIWDVTWISSGYFLARIS